jgi:hypothetical protein
VNGPGFNLQYHKKQNKTTKTQTTKQTNKWTNQMGNIYLCNYTLFFLLEFSNFPMIVTYICATGNKQEQRAKVRVQ